MNSIFTDEGHQEILNRINKLDEASQANWGKMDVSQMLKHCQIALEIATEKRELNMKMGFFKKLLMKGFKPMMYNDKAWRHNVQTPKQFVITDTYVFTPEKDNLVALINEFAAKKDQTEWPEHPAFGHFTPEQRGKMQYKHLDHHLRQFGT
jgi:hypothetical protein